MQERLSRLLTILGGETTIFLHLQFLIKSNKTDMLILKNTKVMLLLQPQIMCSMQTCFQSCRCSAAI